MRRKRVWEIGATAALLLVVGVAAVNGYVWQRRQQELNASLADELGHWPTVSRVATGRLLSQGADIRTRGSYGQTVLMVAVQADDLALAKQALDAGVPLNGRVLFLATKDGSSEMVELLLERGAMVDEREPVTLEMTPLMQAAYGCQPSKIRMLLSAGADPTLRDDTGKTALDHASGILFQRGRAESVRLLKEALARRRSAAD